MSVESKVSPIQLAQERLRHIAFYAQQFELRVQAQGISNPYERMLELMDKADKDSKLNSLDLDELYTCIGWLENAGAIDRDETLTALARHAELSGLEYDRFDRRTAENYRSMAAGLRSKLEEEAKDGQLVDSEPTLG